MKMDSESCPLQDKDMDVEKIQSDEMHVTREAVKTSTKTKILLFFVVFGSFISQFILWGMLNNYGIVKSYLQKDMPSGKEVLAQLGSINYAVVYIVGLFFGPAVNLIGVKYVHITGCLINFSALLVSSFLNNYVAILALYGVLYGAGASLIFFSTIYIATEEFKENVAMVSGFISSGSCIGTLLQSLLLEPLCLKIGWNNVFRMYAVIMALLSFVAFLYYIPEYLKKKNVQNNNSGGNKPKIETGRNNFSSYLYIFKTSKFLIMCVSGFIFMVGYLIPIFYIKNFAESRGVSTKMAASLVGCYAICSLIGRLLIAFSGNVLEKFQLYILITGYFLMGMGNILSQFCSSFILFIVYAGFIGFFEAPYCVLPVPIIKNFFKEDKSGKKEEINVDLSDCATKGISIFYFLQAIAIGLSIFITNALYSKYNNHSMVFSMAGGCLIFSSLVLVLIGLMDLLARFNKEV